MKREETIDYNIKAAWHAIARMYNAEAAKYKLTISVGYILLNIDIENGTPATKIAPLLGLEARSITRTLRNMEKEGFIRKIQDKKDKRFFRIFLTEKGKEQRKISRRTVLLFNQIVRDKLNETQIKHFFEVIETVQEVINQDIFNTEELLEKRS